MKMLAISQPKWWGGILEINNNASNSLAPFRFRDINIIISAYTFGNPYKIISVNYIGVLAGTN